MRIGRIEPGSSAAIDLLNAMFKKGSSSTSSGSSYSDSSGEAVKAIQSALSERQAVLDGVSDYAKLKSSFSKLSDDRKSELSQILSKAATQIKKGSLDAETLADGASTELKKALKAEGVDLEDALDSLDYLYTKTKAKIFDSNGALR